MKSTLQRILSIFLIFLVTSGCLLGQAAQISRQHDAEISNGQVINADDLDDELNTQVSESNSQDTRITTLESGTTTISGVKTFSSTPLVNAINERTTDSGVTIDGMLIQDGKPNIASIRATVSSVDTGTETITTTATHGFTTGDAVRVRVTPGGTIIAGLSASTIYYARAPSTTTLTLHPTSSDASGNTNTVNLTSAGSGTIHIIGTPTSPREGDIWHDTALKTYKGGATVRVADSVDIKGLKVGCVPAYASASTITIATGQWRDSTNVDTITVSSPLTVDITVSGAGGRSEAAAEASNTWYYPYLIKKSSDGTVNAVLSTVNEASSGSITMPSGYDLKRQLPFAVRNNGSSNFLKFYVANGWPYRPMIMWDDPSIADATYAVLSAGTATTAFSNPGGGTNVSCSGFIPPISTLGNFTYYTSYSSGSGTFFGQVKDPDGISTTGEYVGIVNHLGQSIIIGTGLLGTDSSQNIAYKVSVSTISLSIYVNGFIVTEVS